MWNTCLTGRGGFMPRLANAVRKFFAPQTFLHSNDDKLEQLENYKHDVRDVAHDFLIVALAGKLCQVDGKVNPQEIEGFYSAFPDIQVHQKVDSLLIEAGMESVSYEHYARRIMAFFPENRRMHSRIVEALCNLAVADGPLNGKEISFLLRVADVFGCGRDVCQGFFERHILPTSGSPYSVLGVSKSVSYEDLRSRYCNMVRDYHPDQLALLSAAPEIIALVNRRIALLSEAFSVIKQERRLRKAVAL